jgi:hypothetical protein
MRVETTFTSDNKMIIAYSGKIISETDLNTGITKVFKGGEFKTEWPNMTVDEFCKRQKHIIESGKIIEDSKPKFERIERSKKELDDLLKSKP